MNYYYYYYLITFTTTTLHYNIQYLGDVVLHTLKKNSQELPLEAAKE